VSVARPDSTAQSSELIDSLEAVIREHIVEVMPDRGSSKLQAMPLPELLIVYGTWLSRLVSVQPRRCHRSRELQASPKAIEHQAALAAISAKIEAGDDLRPHLSKGVENGLGVDRMLADLGIHHLHLSSQLEPDGHFVERGGDLLFAAFQPDDAYLVGFYEHVTDWARKDILGIVARNWPDADIVHELKFATGLSQDFNDADRRELQQAGFSTGAMVVDGKVYMTLGQSVAGNPYSANQLRMVVMHTLDDWREHLSARLDEAAHLVNEAASRRVSGAWTPIVHNGQAGLLHEDVFHPIVRLS
jgi:hypothetical protein